MIVSIDRLLYVSAALLAGLAAVNAAAQGEHCTDLIQMSRTVSRTLIQESNFAEHKNHFCDEYQRARSGDRTANYGGSYRFLEISMGESSSTEENVASKYCRFDGDTRQRDSDYREYLEGVAPGAFRAYEACLSASETGVEFSLLAPPTRNELKLAVFYNTDVADASAELEWRGSEPVKCSWSGNRDATTTTATLNANSRVILACRRSNAATPLLHEADYVSAYRVGGGAGSVISIPWAKYNEENEPVPTLANIRSSLHAKVDDVAEAVHRAMRDVNGQVTDQQSLLEAFLQRHWHDRTSVRSAGSEYENTTGIPVELSVTVEDAGRSQGNDCKQEVWIDGERIVEDVDAHDRWRRTCSATVTVPPDAQYTVNAYGIPSNDVRVVHWYELSASD